MTEEQREVIIRDEDSLTVAKPTKIFIGKCPDCKLPSRFEPDFPAVRSVSEFTTNCLHCDTLMTAERLWATETTGSCDSRCMGATGNDCECACGGVNHAGAFVHNRHKSEETEKYIQRLIAQREKREEATRKRREKRAAEAAKPFNEWLESLDTADAALVSWMRSYENVADAPTGLLVDFRLRMMATPGKEAQKPARPLTEKQMAHAWRVMDKMAAECEREHKMTTEGSKVPEGRIRVHGKVISRRIDGEDYPWTTYKILLQCDGYRLWGNCPSDLVPHVWPRQSYEERVNTEPAVPENLYVEFNATVQPSDRDPEFGFWRNPRKAELSVPADECKIPGLDITVGDAKRIAERVNKPQSAQQSAPKGESKVKRQDAPEKRSAPRKSGSHAECTLSARMKRPRAHVRSAVASVRASESVSPALS